jgi:uncharacterized membrane protein
MTLAALIEIGLLLALIFSGVVLARAWQGKTIRLDPRLELAIPLLSLLGLGVAIYLTYVETTQAVAVCGPVGDCNSVQNSPYAKLFGVLPVGLLGAGGYLIILAAWAWGRWREDVLADYVPPAILGMSVFGTLFSVYLTYLELFVIKAACIWCLSSAALIALIMLASLPRAASWIASTEDE